jgi:hypothetical protein
VRPLALASRVAAYEDTEEVWIAAGLKRRWRVVSMQRTFGEFDRVADAYAFLGLLLEGNPQMRGLE